MDRIPVPAAARVFVLLEAFAVQRRALTNREIAQAMDLPESSCSNLVATLLQAGYLAREPGHKVYPSAKLLALSKKLHREDPSWAIPRRRAEELRDRTHETVMVGRIERGLVRVVLYCDGHFPMRYALPPSHRISLHASALGKAILARTDDDEARRQLRMKPLAPLTPHTPTSLRALMAQVARFREQGFAYVENEGAEEVVALAMAGDFEGRPLAMSIAGPLARMRLRFDLYLEALRHAARTTFDAAE